MEPETATTPSSSVTPFHFSRFEPASSLSDRVYDAIEQLIVDGVLSPGRHLVEDALAVELGVSRNPVRQALQRLSHEGLVQHETGRGAFVHLPSAKEVDDVFHLRILLESECARLAASRVTPGDLRSLKEILALGDAAVKKADAVQLLELNDRFHHVIIEAADNPVMAKFMQSLRRRIRWYFSSVVVTRATGSWEQHAEIYSALKVRDGERCASIMADHVRQTLEKIQGGRDIE